ncbi:MAG: amino acid adenylation domain-containing protein [Chloroflexota bacterium]
MNWRLFLDSLQKEGGHLQLDGDDIVYNGPSESLTPERLQTLKGHKAEIIDFIRRDFTLHPVSYGQNSLWFEYQMTPDGAGYNISLALRIHSPLDSAALRKAFQGLVNRHAALRTTFTVVEGVPNQVVHRHLQVNIEPVDASQWTEDFLYEQATAAHEAPFDLEDGPLFRLNLWMQHHQEHVLLVTLHHLIFDGWSKWILLDEMEHLYRAALSNTKPTLPPLKTSYTDYVEWQHAMIEGEGDKLWTYWQEQLSGDLPLLELPLDHPRPATSRYEGASLPITISSEKTDQLRLLAQKHSVTPYMLFLATFQLLLHRYTGQDDILVGSPMAGRSRPEFASIFGYFVSPVMMRAHLADNPTFAQLLQQIRRSVLGAFEHQDFPFQLLVERLKPIRLPNRAPIYDAMFTMQQPQTNLVAGDPSDLPSDAASGEPEAEFVDPSIKELGQIQWGELEVSYYPLAQYGGAFDLFLELSQEPDTITGFIHYNPNLFEAGTIQRMANHFFKLLDGVIQNPQQLIGEIPLITDAEYHQLLVEWNRPQSRYLESKSPAVDTEGVDSVDSDYRWVHDYANKSLHQLFEEQAVRTPEAIALTLPSESSTIHYPPSTITYRELNARANQLAHHLQSLGVGTTYKPNHSTNYTDLGAETLVGLCVERSIEMVVGILAVLKAGGAYVPLDPTSPPERLAFMLEDSEISILLTQSHLRETVPSTTSAQVVEIDKVGLTQTQGSNPESHCTPDSLAYIIYTSGSTGKPKGVMVTHHNVTRLFAETDHWYHFAEDDVWTLFHSYAFDFSVWELWGALLYGGRLVVAPYLVSRSPEAFYHLLCQEGITVLNQTPSAFRQLIHVEEAILDRDGEIGRQGHQEARANLSLRYIIFGGEALELSSLQPWFDRHGDTTPQLVNMYGITETTVHVTYRPIRQSDLIQDGSGQPASVIGGPIPDLQLYILDAYQQPVPVGLSGELYVGGAGVSRGYLNRPELTEERFLPNPFGAGRLYRTGDLAKRLPDGDIEYLGRIDNQVKIRGFRIELGEIESVLLQHMAIREAVVIVREDAPGDKRLVAYLVVSGQGASGQVASDAPANLRKHLRQQLPDYMVPSAFVFLEAFPLTGNGKLDRKALPTPETVVHTSSSNGDGADAQGPIDDVTAAGSAADNGTSPGSSLQQLVMTIWQEELNVAQVDIHDNFFEIGGHSLLMLQIHSRLQPLVEERLNKPLAVVDLFRYPTIHLLCQYLVPEAAPEEKIKPQVKQLGEQNEIAIVGMAGRFPGASSIAALWENLRNAVESIEFLSDEALMAAGVSPEQLTDPDYVKAAALLEEIEYFDADFFGFSQREAQLLDPQVRLFLECAWEALEHTGCDPERYPGAIGVYAGSGANNYLDYADIALDSSADGDAYDSDSLSAAAIYQAMTANGKDFLSTRLSYKLNLTGPGITVQTACSTSLVAIHLACQGLRNGECDMALAGGVTVNTYQGAGYLYQEGMILSPDGHCRAFDAEANGTVAGSGLGIVALKRLDDALAEGDLIHAVIKGSAINNDGSTKVAYMAPSVDGQVEVIRQALANADVDPNSIAYVETHGTATKLGDQIELTALKEVFQSRMEEPESIPLTLGAVKTNFGHLDTAAGVTNVIKTALALNHQLLPPTLHFTAPNPQLDFPTELFQVQTELMPWPAPSAVNHSVNGTITETTNEVPRRAGVSSFGIGGTNAHVVLEEAPQREPIVHEFERSHHLLTLSGKNERALYALVERYIDFLSDPDGEKQIDEAERRIPTADGFQSTTLLGDICYTTHTGRRHFDCRLSVTGASAQDLTQKLTEHLQGEADGISEGFLASNQTPPKVAFLFTGQGAQYAGMGQELYKTEPIFRHVIDQCDEILQECLGRSLIELLYPAGEQVGKWASGQVGKWASGQVGKWASGQVGKWASDETKPANLSPANLPNDLMESHPCGQAVNFALECALVELWRSWGVEPDYVLGHSLGDFAAAYTAGVLSLEDGLRLVTERGKLMETADGDMLSVMASEAEAAPFVSEYADVTIGVVNGPKSIVISGQRIHVAQVDDALQEAGFKTRKLAIPVAAHSPMLDPVLDEFEAAVERVTLSPPTSAVVSSMTGALANDDLTDPAYWRRHLRNTVHFDQGVRTLSELGCTLFIEIGPKPTLLGMVEQVLDAMIDDVGVENQGDKVLLEYPVMLPSLRNSVPDWEQMLTSLGELYVQGIEIDWDSFDKNYRRRKVALPSYPFQRQRYWIERNVALMNGMGHGELNGTEAKDGFAQLLSDHTSDGQIEQLTDLIAGRREFSAEDKSMVSKVLAALEAESRALQVTSKIDSMIYEVTWEPQPKSVRVIPETPGYWLILAEHTSTEHANGENFSVGTALARQLSELGETVQVLAADSWSGIANLDELTQQLISADTEKPPLRGVIHLWGLNDPISDLNPASSENGGSLESVLTLPKLTQSQERNLGTLLHIVQTLTTTEDKSPRLWVVTQGAQQVLGNETVDVTQTPLWGFGRNVTLEHSDLWGGLIDIDNHGTPAEMAQTLLAEIWPSDLAESKPTDPRLHGDKSADPGLGEEQIAYRQGERFVARLVSAHPTLTERASSMDSSIDPEGSYLITGGLGSLGLQNAYWLAEQGARHLILIGRRGVQIAEQQAVLDALAAQGADVKIVQVDVADEIGMTQLFADIASTNAPLRGVIHAAGIGAYQSLDSLTWDDFETVLHPKVAGSWLLHRLTAELALDFFIGYSSGAAIWGSKQQSHYGAANHFLDGLMAYRRSQGLPGLSLAWGLWQPADMTSPEAQQFVEGFEAIGVRPFLPEEGLAVQAQLIRTDATQVTVADVDWAHLQTFFELSKPRRFLEKVARQSQSHPSRREVADTDLTSKSGPRKVTLRQRLEEASIEERSPILIQHLQRELGKILGIPTPEKIDMEQGLLDMGLDSLMAVEIRNRLGKSLEQRLPATLIFDYPTLNHLVRYIQQVSGLEWENSTEMTAEMTAEMTSEKQETTPESVSNLSEIASASVTGSTTESMTELEEISDEEAADLLAAKLEKMGFS